MYMTDRSESDEKYTPAEGVLPIVEFIPKDAVIWCPFDTEESEFVKVLSKTNPVVFTHIDTGDNFYFTNPKKWDIMVSNPPFTNKRYIFERALALGKPFALLMSLDCFNDKFPAWSFHNAGKQMQLLKFDKRITYTGERAPFQSGYICNRILPRDIITRPIKEVL